MLRPRTIVLVAPNDGKPHLYAGYAKAYADSRPELAGRVAVSLMHVENYVEAAKLLTEAPDMICFAPSEERPLESLFTAAHEVKARFPQALVVSCTEDPRNRLRLREAFTRGGLDYVLHGQSEKSLSLLAAALWLDSGEALSAIPGLKSPAMVFEAEQAPAPR